MVRACRERYAWLPEDYWDLLSNVGYGELAWLYFYEGPCEPTALGLLNSPAGFVAFADDMSGCFFGFQDGSSTVVALDSADWAPVDTAQTFREFLLSQLGDEVE